MGWLDWLKGPRVTKFDDSFALNRENLWPQLRVSIRRQMEEGFTPWIVCHFGSTFEHVQALLTDWQIDYDIASHPILPKDAHDFAEGESKTVLLVLADLLESDSSGQPQEPTTSQVSLIVVERHPLIRHDDRIRQFAETLGGKVRYGYLLSVDDVVISRVVNDLTIQILKQLGMGDHELIASNMITKRLDKALARDSVAFATDIRADSAEEWYRLNDPQVGQSESELNNKNN